MKAAYSIRSSDIQLTPIATNFLEMHQPPRKKLVLRPDTAFELLPKPVSASHYRHYYYGVGAEWSWLDRMVIPDEELEQKINTLNTEIYIFYVDNEPAGFAEFVKENDFTEIQYFGLLPAFVGKGLGNYFLHWVIQQAWAYQPQWIQLNTCALDHPNALPVYKKAGFEIVRTEIQQRRMLKND